MPKPVKARVHKSLIRWGRETAGYSIEDVARHLSKAPADIEKWEQGSDHPYMGQLNRMADMFGRPISDFFLPEPPEERPLPHDFRWSSGGQVESCPPDLRKQIRFARERRDLALYLLEELGNDVADFGHRVGAQSSPEAVGEAMREILGVRFDQQKSCEPGYPALDMWRELIERQDILVFQFEKVQAEEAWGVSICEKQFPIIGINKKLAPNERTFTLLHEAAHLLLGQSRVCGPSDLAKRNQSNSCIEAYCNQAAAAALLPKDDFLFRGQETMKRNAYSASDEMRVKELTSCFGASEEVVAWRLLNFDLSTPDHSGSCRAPPEARAAKQAAEKKKRQNQNAQGGQAAPQRAVSDYGTIFVKAVLSSLKEELITLADASQYLHVSPSAVPEVEGIVINGQSAA